MWRSLKAITLAIQLASSPSMSKSTAASYASVVQTEAKDRSFDPFTLVAIVHSESRWHASAVSKDHEDIGLGQVRARFIGACRSDPDPVKSPGKDCAAVRAALKQGAYNLRVAASLITQNRKFCTKKTGKPALWKYWLASYGGRNRPSQNVWCGQRLVKGRWIDLPVHKNMWKVMRYRAYLIRRTGK